MTVAILGDSAMWGQGLRAEHQFARLAAQRIGNGNDDVEVLAGLGEDPGRGYPRSGAKINAAVETGDRVAVLLPSRELTSARPGDRANFVRTFRTLFDTDDQMRSFLAGPDGERPAAGLFGENPAAFPTVAGQLRFTGDQPRPDVDLVIVNGGINDVNFEDVLDPTGPSPAEINRAIDRAFGPALADLLTATRARFPGAVVIVPGYYAALSDASSRDDLKTLFEYLSEKPEWQIAFNDVIELVPTSFPQVGWG
ncbi:MAG TPA: SGNH/GDSL hydrolase family protein [Micromonosporaceae bacterium]|nr:SGNH/GDSL hydrolase family protein [Micromonosporaceae bacterium]